jgi:hypothetical protein
VLRVTATTGDCVASHRLGFIAGETLSRAVARQMIADYESETSDIAFGYFHRGCVRHSPPSSAAADTKTPRETAASPARRRSGSAWRD